MWTITNSSNNMTNTIVRGTLPPYVSWVGRIDPAQAGVSFDEKQAKWCGAIGRCVIRRAGFRAAPEVAFQIVFTPSVSLLREGAGPYEQTFFLEEWIDLRGMIFKNTYACHHKSFFRPIFCICAWAGGEIGTRNNLWLGTGKKWNI